MTYVVTESTPGCLPETEPEAYETLAEAQVRAETLVREIQETLYEDEEPLIATSFTGMTWRIVSPGQNHDLGRVVTIVDTRPEPAAFAEVLAGECCGNGCDSNCTCF